MDSKQTNAYFYLYWLWILKLINSYNLLKFQIGKIASSNPLSEVLEGDAPLASIRENLSNDELQEDIRIEKRGSQEGEFLQSSAKGFSNLKLGKHKYHDITLFKAKII